MSQTSRDKSGQPVTARADELLDSMGHRIGLFVARAGQRIQNAAASVREQADRMDQPDTADDEKSHQPTTARAEEKGQVAMEKSEELVDRMAQQLSIYTARAGLQIQKAVARMREEAEDIWAEAQHLRQENGRKPQ